MKAFPDSFNYSRAALFDWLSFLLSLSLSFIFTDLRDLVQSDIYSYFIFWALFAYSAGALLKHAPLRYRLEGRAPEIPYTLFLIIGHWLIVWMAILLAEPAASKMMGLASAPGKELTERPGFWICFAISFLLTWIVFRNRKWPTERKNNPPPWLAVRELAADLLLLAGVGSLSFVFWEKSIMGMMASRTIRTATDIWYQFIFLCFAYVLFYLPLRYLFLLEDYRSRRAWRRLLILFGLLLLRALFEMLRT